MNKLWFNEFVEIVEKIKEEEKLKKEFITSRKTRAVGNISEDEYCLQNPHTLYLYEYTNMKGRKYFIEVLLNNACELTLGDNNTYYRTQDIELLEEVLYEFSKS